MSQVKRQRPHVQPRSPLQELRRVWHRAGLTITLMLLFGASWIGQMVAGFFVHNEEQRTLHQPEVSFSQYLRSAHFWEATAENWESEFLQMGMFVILTAFLFQKGSPESKDPDSPEDDVDEDPFLHQHDPDAPGPVKRGGWLLKLYSNSLSLAFFSLFMISFATHVFSSHREYNHEQVAHGEPTVTLIQFIASSQLWFESFQNWQSEFLSIAAMVVLAIFLRQKGSTESKPVHRPHWENE